MSSALYLSSASKYTYALMQVSMLNMKRVFHKTICHGKTGTITWRGVLQTGAAMWDQLVHDSTFYWRSCSQLAWILYTVNSSFMNPEFMNSLGLRMAHRRTEFFPCILWTLSIQTVNKFWGNKMGQLRCFWFRFMNRISSGIRRLLNREKKVVGQLILTKNKCMWAVVLHSHRHKGNSDSLLKSKCRTLQAALRPAVYLVLFTKHLHQADLNFQKVHVPKWCF